MIEQNQKRLTVQSLRFYVPFFQKADDFYELYSENITPENKTLVYSSFKIREMVVDRIMDLLKPLFVKEIHKMISKSHLRKDTSELFDLLYYAGRDGAVRGLRHFDVNMIDTSATNYLFSWVLAYCQKELNTVEAAPFGLPVSTFKVYKKISAVRKKLTEDLGHYATNDEVFDFFQSGNADVKTMLGKKKNANVLSQANQKITTDVIKEQEFFEKNIISQTTVDPLNQETKKAVFGSTQKTSFRETIFGVFLESYPFTAKARVVLMSEVHADMNDEEKRIFDRIDSLTFKRIVHQWKLLFRDKNGIFSDFLEKARYDGYEEIDISRILKNLKNQPDLVKQEQWKTLLKNNIPRRKDTK